MEPGAPAAAPRQNPRQGSGLFMRIAHVLDSGGLYGAERVLLELATEQQRAGHMPIIVSIGEPHPDDKPIESASRARGLEVRAIRMAPGPNPSGAWRVREQLRADRADLVHSHGYKSNILLGLMPARLRGRPMMATIHGYTRPSGWSKLAIYGRLDRRVLRRLDRVVLVHEGMRQTPALHGLWTERWRVIENGIAEAPSMEATRSAEIEAFCRQAPVVGTAGRLSPEKGFDILIEAFARVVGNGSTARLLILGEGPERGALEARIARHGLADRVMLPGYVADAGVYLPLFDVFVLSSLTEGLPLTVLEAMRASRPIVATRVGGVPSILGEGRSGRLVPPGDADALSVALSATLRDPAAAAALAAAAREAFGATYSSRRMADRYEALYEEILRERRSRLAPTMQVQ
jgi:glycosyltransferase involved in cell wall biosynthesis